VTDKRLPLTYPDLTAPLWRVRKIWAVYVLLIMLTLATLLG
jgi:hypothetical protein